MTDLAIRRAEAADRAAIFSVEEHAFGRDGEASLVERLVADGDAILELVAELGGTVVGHILFSRLFVEDGNDVRFPAVALAPLAVQPEKQNRGIGSALVCAAHALLEQQGERLSVVLGEPAHYGRFGYTHDRASGFDSDYQCEALQALAWGDAPSTGRLVYPAAFGAL